MQHEKEINFFKSLLKNLHLPCRLITNVPERAYELDFGLRRTLNPCGNYEEQLRSLLLHFHPNKIYRITDELMCHYFFFQMPDSPIYIMIGPYTLEEITRKDILNLSIKYAFPAHIISQLEKIYFDIPIFRNENILLALVNTFGEQVWGGIDNFSLQDVKNSAFFDMEPVAARPDNKEPEDAFVSMKKLEMRYEGENNLMQAVSQGQTHRAEMLINSFTSSYIEKRALNPVRNLKNYMIILNTVLRKAAEAGTVHPLHIDSLSSRFARQIEQALTEDTLLKLQNEMVHKYCLLVKNHSMRGYSLLVRKILVRIDSDLTADLSLKAQADFLNVNPSYLSTLFKKETGATLTDYVNRKRVEHGIFLLNSTDMQIQAIAQNCGIPDVNYFTKTFKKIVGKTPKEYRENVVTYVRKSG